MLRRLIGILTIVTLVSFAVQAQDTQYQGYIDNNTPFVDFSLNLNAGDSVVMTTTATDGDLDTVLTLLDPNGTVLGENDDRSQDTLDSALGYSVPSAGTYTVRVGRYDGSETSGHFRLDINIGGPEILQELDSITRVQLSGPEHTRDTVHFRIHYTVNGADSTTEEYVDALELSVEEIWRIQIDHMHWPTPPSDGTRGGNALYDVYLSDLVGSGDHALGYTVPEDYVGDDPDTPDITENAATSYIVLENDFDLDLSDYPAVIALMRTTMSHEFNHAIQFAYDTGDMQWYYEATSTWMETRALVKDEDATGYVEYVYKYPELCFGSEQDIADGLSVYGSWLFIQALEDEHGIEGVQRLWQNIANYDGFDALEHTLNDYGEDIEGMLPAYHIQNLVRKYALASDFYSTVWLENTITGVGRWTYTGEGIQELAANYFDLRSTPGIYYVGLTNDDGLLNLWAVGVRGGEADVIPLGRGGTIDTDGYDYFYLMVYNPIYDDTVGNCTYYDYSLDIAAGKGTLNPVARSIDAANFEPLE